MRMTGTALNAWLARSAARGKHAEAAKRMAYSGLIRGQPEVPALTMILLS
jgi:hypothetical protein